MANEKLTKERCIALLQEKAEALAQSGRARYPERADFTAEQVMAVKAHLGPWPRALEQAGVKPLSAGREGKRLEKRINSKRKKTQRKIDKNADVRCDFIKNNDKEQLQK